MYLYPERFAAKGHLALLALSPEAPTLLAQRAFVEGSLEGLALRLDGSALLTPPHAFSALVPPRLASVFPLNLQLSPACPERFTRGVNCLSNSNRKNTYTFPARNPRRINTYKMPSYNSFRKNSYTWGVGAPLVRHFAAALSVSALYFRLLSCLQRFSSARFASWRRFSSHRATPGSLQLAATVHYRK